MVVVVLVVLRQAVQVPPAGAFSSTFSGDEPEIQTIISIVDPPALAPSRRSTCTCAQPATPRTRGGRSVASSGFPLVPRSSAWEQ